MSLCVDLLQTEAFLQAIMVSHEELAKNCPFSRIIVVGSLIRSKPCLTIGSLTNNGAMYEFHLTDWAYVQAESSWLLSQHLHYYCTIDTIELVMPGQSLL